jgi:uncharacterized protein (TIRG00374 family)
LGDVVRAYLIGELETRSKAWALATVIVERVFDIAALLAIIVLLIPFVSLPGWAVESARIAAILAVAGVAVICVAWFGRSFIGRRFGLMTTRLPEGPMVRLRSTFGNMIDGLAVLGQPSQLSSAALLSIALWGTTGAVMWATLIAFDVEASPSIAMLLVVVSAVTVAVPLAPSAAGVFHAAIIETMLVVTSVNTSTATSVAITSHILLFAPPVVCGLASFWLVPGIADLMLAFRRSSRKTSSPQTVSGGTLPPAM